MGVYVSSHELMGASLSPTRSSHLPWTHGSLPWAHGSLSCLPQAHERLPWAEMYGKGQDSKTSRQKLLRFSEWLVDISISLRFKGHQKILLTCKYFCARAHIIKIHVNIHNYLSFTQVYLTFWHRHTQLTSLLIHFMNQNYSMHYYLCDSVNCGLL